MSDVFLSYSSKDRAAAERVQQAVARRLFCVWPGTPRASTGTPGSATTDRREGAIVLWSKESIKSPMSATKDRRADAAARTRDDRNAVASDFPMALSRAAFTAGLRSSTPRLCASGFRSRSAPRRGSGAGTPPKNLARKVSEKPSPSRWYCRLVSRRCWRRRLVVLSPPAEGSLRFGTTVAEAKPDAPVDGAKSLPQEMDLETPARHWRTATHQPARMERIDARKRHAGIYRAGQPFCPCHRADAPLRTQTSVIEPTSIAARNTC